MGRWVTSKGRRIYIPDEGEENPFAKTSDSRIKSAKDFQGNQDVADKYNDYVKTHSSEPDKDGYRHEISFANGTYGNANITDSVYQGERYVGTDFVGIRTNKDGEVDYLRNGSRYKDISYLRDAGQGKRVPSYMDQVRPSKSKLDFSSQGTYSFKGQAAPKDLPRVSDDEAGHNKVVSYQGTNYQTQQVRDWDRNKNQDYVAGHLYVPQGTLSKGSFFVSKDNKIWHDGSQYFQDKANAEMAAMFRKK